MYIFRIDKSSIIMSSINVSYISNKDIVYFLMVQNLFGSSIDFNTGRNGFLLYVVHLNFYSYSHFGVHKTLASAHKLHLY